MKRIVHEGGGRVVGDSYYQLMRRFFEITDWCEVLISDMHTCTVMHILLNMFCFVQYLFDIMYWELMYFILICYYL